jgi:hypothetical protein
MAVIGTISIIMQTATAKFKQGLAVASSEVKAFGGGLRGLQGELALVGVVAGGAAAAGLWQMSKGAIALGEQTNRAGIDFGEFAGTVVDQSKLAGTAFGVSRKAFLASASSFAQTFAAAKYGEKDVASLSVAMVNLAADMSSKVHIPIEEALLKLQSGLAGQARPLHSLGIFMTEDGIKAYAAAKGIARLGTELTESQKIQARLGFIMESSTKFIGNLGQTSDSAGNLVRSLSGRIENLSDTVGTALNTIVGPAVADLALGVQVLQLAWERTSIAQDAAKTGLAEGAAVQVAAIGPIQKSVMFVADAWDAVRLGFLSVRADITRGIAGLIGTIGMLEGALNKVGKFFGKKADISDFFKVWQQDLEVLAAKLDADFNKEWLKPAASSVIADLFTEAKKVIGDARKELARPGEDVTKLTPMAGPAKLDAPKFASAMAAGSKEAVNLELRSRYGAGAKDDSAAKTARHTGDAVKLLSRIAASVGGGSVRPGADAAGALLGAKF